MYSATGVEDGEPMAVKWYLPDRAGAAQREHLQRLLDVEPAPAFLWPFAEVTIEGREGFGYAMALRPDNFTDLTAFLNHEFADGRELDPDFAVVFNTGFGLARAFQRLHARGLSYRDISPPNVFFDPVDGNVLVCDCDNIGIDDGTGLVNGTPMFKAPEIVTGQKPASRETDLWSLAVLLFHLLMEGHPLEGARTSGLVDQDWMLTHFGTDPLFCFDPVDEGNRPDEDSTVARYWAYYPTFLRNLFIKTFCDGVRTPDDRAGEGEWADAMVRLRNLQFDCPSCSGRVIWDPDVADQRCLRCGEPLPPPLVAEVHNKHVDRRTDVPAFEIVLDAQTEIASLHLDLLYDDVTLLFETEPARSRPDALALVNVSGHHWTVRYRGAAHELAPGASVFALEGASLHRATDTIRIRRARVPDVTG